MKETDNVFSYASQYGTHSGLTARDYIAIQAMVGLCANSKLRMDENEIADFAYRQADAIIERSKK